MAEKIFEKLKLIQEQITQLLDKQYEVLFEKKKIKSAYEK